MADLLPSSPDIEAPDGEPRVLGVDSEDADAVLAALSSGTSRSILATLHDDPSTPSEVADRVDTSLQNTQYHLEKLLDADLVEVCGTRYSEKGREMRVYAPTDGPLVLFPGDQEERADVQRALLRLLGAVGVLGVASLAVQWAFGGGVAAPTSSPTPSPSGGGGGGPSIMSSPETTVAHTTTAAASGGADVLHGLPPGVLFFLGGLLVVCLVGVARWYGA